MSPELSSAEKANKSWLPRQRPLRHGKQTNFKLIIHSHSSANPVNLVKIGPLDVELISLTAVVNNKKQQQIAGRTVQQPGGLNYFITIANKLSPWGRRDSIPPPMAVRLAADLIRPRTDPQSAQG